MKKRNLINRVRRGTALVTMAALLTTNGCLTAWAASTITSVTVRVNLDLETGDALPNLDYGVSDSSGYAVNISSNTKYDIQDAEWSKDVDEIELGDTYTLKVTLDANSGYEFKSSYNSSKVTVKGGKFVSAKRNSDDDLVVTIRTKEAKGTFETPEDADWQSENSNSDKFGIAKWRSVKNADYEVQLYRGEKVVHKVTGLEKTSYNFYPYMTREGDYSFRVRAIPENDSVAKDAAKSECLYSDEMFVDEDEVSDGSGQGQEETTGNTPVSTQQVGWVKTDGKWFFRYPDGTYLRDSWGKISDKWYLFNSKGEMLTGWQKAGDKWYYLNPDGDMKTGWFQDKNVWYYLNPDGSMAIGWINVNNVHYCMGSNGAMLTGWQEVGGQWYYFYPDGHKAANEVISGFYVDHNGVWHRP